MQCQGIVLQVVFESVGEALAVLITLDEVFNAAELFKEHWEQYKRYVLFVKVKTSTNFFACQSWLVYCHYCYTVTRNFSRK